MSKRAEERALEAYPNYPTLDRVYITQRRRVFIQGYEAAEKDIIAIIESRIAEILGDAQPKPTIRIELKELITRIMEAENPVFLYNWEKAGEEFFDAWWNATTSEAIKKLTSNLESVIKEAFKEHFGFPIEEVKDTESLERISHEGCPMSWYRYHEETFLYWVDSPTVKNENGQVTLTTTFLKI